MKKLEISITKNGIKVIGDGQELLTTKAISITMDGEEEKPQPTPEPTPEPTPKSEVYTFDAWNPQVTHTRLTEPKGDWAVLHCISENQKSVHLPQNVQSVGDMLVLTVKPQSAKYGDAEKAYTSGLAYSRRMFGKGRLDVRANLSGDKAVKNSIWVTTSAMTDKETGLRYLYEWDWVEYTPADTGSNNTSRGMWMWQENAQSVSDKALPYIFPDKGYSLSGGCWYWTGKAWTQTKLYNIYRNGNRLKGRPSGRTYYITNTERGKEIDSADLRWIRDDGKIGQGLDGNQWFVVTDREPLGLGADKSQFLDGKTSISGWHIWSLIVDDDYIAYLCDGKEYWRITNDQLHELTIQDDITFNVIFATNVIGTPKGNVEMQVDYVKFTPKE